MRTVFLENREDCCQWRIYRSSITVGASTDPFTNSVCAAVVTDGGWYECPTILEGDIISVQRVSLENKVYNLNVMRAYYGINVAQYATVSSEPAAWNGDWTATNLLTPMASRTGQWDRQQT